MVVLMRSAFRDVQVMEIVVSRPADLQEQGPSLTVKNEVTPKSIIQCFAGADCKALRTRKTLSIGK